MTNKLTAEEIEALKAVDVMSQPPRPQEEVEIEQKINDLELARINLRVSPSMFNRLNMLAEFKGITIEQHCAEILKESLEVAVGAPTITGPSSLGGIKLKKVTGPSFAVKDL
jgi:hypothetical protein